MKSLKTLMATIALVVSTLTATAHPMSYAAMRNNARFLTDRMAYTLGLGASLIDDLYYINYDYICGVNDYLDDVALGYYYDDYMEVVYRRDYALQRILSPHQWAMLMTYDYFYRPISFVNRAWRFSIYAFDHRHTHFYYRKPRHFRSYAGGNHFHGMRPAPHRGPSHNPGHRSGNRPGFTLGPVGNNRPNGGNVGNHGNVNRPNGGNNNRPGNSTVEQRPGAGGSSNGSVRPNNNGGRNESMKGNNGGGRSETNMRSSSRRSSNSSSSSVSRSSSSRSNSSVSRSSGSGNRSNAGRTRGGESQSRGGRR